jgi:hypothetical protein
MITLDEFYSVRCDRESCTLYYEKENGINEDTGKVKFERDQWYYPNLRVALSNYLLKSAAKSESIQEVLSRISEVETKIENICK